MSSNNDRAVSPDSSDSSDQEEPIPGTPLWYIILEAIEEARYQHYIESYELRLPQAVLDTTVQILSNWFESVPSTKAIQAVWTAHVAFESCMEHYRMLTYFRRDVGIDPIGETTEIFVSNRRDGLLEEQQVKDRLEFAQQMHQKVQSKLIDVNNIIFTDQLVLVWVASSGAACELHLICGLNVRLGLIGPQFLEEAPGFELSAKYRNLVQFRMIPEIKRKLREKGMADEEFGKLWWQQDGMAKYQNDEETIDMLQELFNSQVMSEGAPNKWPAKSPDLNPVNHIWSTLEKRLNGWAPPRPTDHNSKLTASFKRNVRDRCNDFAPDVIERLISTWVEKLAQVIDNMGCHVGHVWAKDSAKDFSDVQPCVECQRKHFCNCPLCKHESKLLLYRDS